MQKEETHKHPRMVESIQLQDPPQVVEFTRCNNAGIKWYGRMPADPPQGDPKGKKLLEPI